MFPVIKFAFVHELVRRGHPGTVAGQHIIICSFGVLVCTIECNFSTILASQNFYGLKYDTYFYTILYNN